MKELEIPNHKIIKSDKRATEIVRFWISSGDCHVNLNMGIWAKNGEEADKEIWIWANVINDIAQHVANGMNQRFGCDVELTKKKITKDFVKCMKKKSPGLKGK